MAGVVKALNENEFDTVIGKFRFNEKGDPNLPPFAVYRWSNGTYEEIGDEAASRRSAAGAAADQIAAPASRAALSQDVVVMWSSSRSDRMDQRATAPRMRAQLRMPL